MVEHAAALNVFGEKLGLCCLDPLTGFFRDGSCHTGPHDHGVHTVCALLTDEFLRFSARSGNDLSTPRPEYDFPGLSDGDQWCLCAGRWLQAYNAGLAPMVKLRSTHQRTLDIVPLEILKRYAIDVV